MRKTAKHTSTPSLPPRYERIRRQLEELERIRQGRLARPIEETLAEVKTWLPERYWPEVEQALRSRDQEEIGLPSDFLSTFRRIEQEAGIEAARRYEAASLEELCREHSGLR